MASSPRRMDAINGWDADFIDHLYAQWRVDPGSVDPSWQHLFRGFELASQKQTNGHAVHSEAIRGVPPGSPESDEISRRIRDQMRVDSLIYHYRSVGHTAAELDPLGRAPEPHPRLRLETHNLSEADLDQVFQTNRLPLPDQAPLREIVSLLRDTYCRTIGVEFMYVNTTENRYELARWMEECRNRPRLSHEEKIWILERLTAANAFETFFGKRYPSHKRFSLEGGDALIPLLDTLVEQAPGHGVRELVLGMAHRGRLNVLCNILGKTYQMICTEFEDTWSEDFEDGGGDVKYHRGFSGSRITRDGRSVRLTLTSNPSHLEAVYPVMLGRTRAKQMLLGDTQARGSVVPIAIHGDAAFAGQGVVYEALQLSMLQGYTVGGTIHVVVNNQIGFTTNPSEARSTPYCTDIVKFLEAPVFHVNGNDPEAVVHVARMAMAWRQKYHQDVVIDLYCYRQHGHNETDEPTFTQPEMYELIRKTPPVHRLYAERLVNDGVIEPERANALEEAVHKAMDDAQALVKTAPVDPTPQDPFDGEWYGMQPDYTHDIVPTGVSREVLERIGDALVRFPEGFTPHPKLLRQMQQRRKSIYEGGPLDWGTAEALAFGSLLAEGTPVRISGQDCRRGTFSHRHAVLVDARNGQTFTPLDGVAAEQARFCCHNSPLSEFAVLGFEYGYSLQAPRNLIIWEAQFGDFANGAQVIIDQFLASAEAKWERCSGLVLLLPHGYEGMGPEHSSARLERFLQLCADDNLEVCYPTTPAQLFHMLRRQVRRAFRKPLIVMSPKSLLRLPACSSTLDQLVDGNFESVIDDVGVDPARVRRLVFCSGKIYYDLAARREEDRRNDVAIIRVEQLHPFPAIWLRMALSKYRRADEFIWAQEEPKNAGAWTYIEPRLRELVPTGLLAYFGRAAAPSPAVGSARMHKLEQEAVVNAALGSPTPIEPPASTPVPLPAVAANR